MLYVFPAIRRARDLSTTRLRRSGRDDVGGWAAGPSVEMTWGRTLLLPFGHPTRDLSTTRFALRSR